MFKKQITAKGLGKKLGGKVGGAVVEKKIMPVVTDPQRLVNYCCGSNYFVEGEDVKVSFSFISSKINN